MRKFDITEYLIKTEKITNIGVGFKFLIISDLHSNDYGINLHEVIGAIRREQPDAILLAGDIINRKISENVITIIKFISAIARRYKVFYALGNHEYTLKMNVEQYGNFYQEYKKMLSDAGVVFLEDETIILKKNEEQIAISGLEIDKVFYSKIPPVMGKGLVDKHLGNVETDIFKLLIAHNPDYFEQYASWGADLVVSGHLHGGTVRIPKVGGIMGTNLEILPKYDAGGYRIDNSRMIVSRGLGAHTIPIRINNRPEMGVVKILAKNSL